MDTPSMPPHAVHNRWLRLVVPLLTFSAGLLCALWWAEPPGLEVEFVNAGSKPIESIQLDFGSAALQSSIRVLRIAPGQSRTLVLNHSPGMGFNVRVRYAGGSEQEFCALRGDDRRRAMIRLAPNTGD